MKLTRKWLVWIAIAYVVACLAIGWATTAFYNHHVYYAWRFTPDPDRAVRWGLGVSRSAVTFPGPQSPAQVKLSGGWIEWGAYRSVTIPYFPIPEWFAANRYSMKIDQDKPFRVLHFDVVTPDPVNLSVRLLDAPDKAKSGCANYQMDQGSRMSCHIMVPGQPQSDFHGHLVSRDGQKRDGTDFVVQVTWPTGDR